MLYGAALTFGYMTDIFAVFVLLSFSIDISHNHYIPGQVALLKIDFILQKLNLISHIFFLFKVLSHSKYILL